MSPDVVIFCTEVSQQIYDGVKPIGFEPQQIVLNASHIHSVPALCDEKVLDVKTHPIAKYQALVVEKIVSVIEQAKEDMRPAVLSISEAVSDIAGPDPRSDEHGEGFDMKVRRPVYLHRRIAAALTILLAAVATAKVTVAQGSDPTPEIAIQRKAYYGDLHLHTSYSVDAYILFNTTLDPEAAYRFAKGEVIPYFGESVRRREPLDFLAVTDHGENIGVMVSQNALGREILAEALSAVGPLTDGRRNQKELGPLLGKYGFYNTLRAMKAESRSAWQREIEAANRYYEPGKFTTFIAYEWGSGRGHRNIIFKGQTAPNPFTTFDSIKPEDLWAWLEEIRKQGYEALAITHTPNQVDVVYDGLDSEGTPIDQAYAEARQANEPLSEIYQIQGSSETHPLLSDNDEFADFEILDALDLDYVQGNARGDTTAARPGGSYLRDALSRGLVLQRRIGFNPYKDGFVGGSDHHNGLSQSAEADYVGFDAGYGPRPTKDQAARILSPSVQDDYLLRLTIILSASGLTGVWAESNTRESIYGALRRKETFATSGTKLKFRIFGGWSFGKGLLQRDDWIATAYSAGVPMGSDLPARPIDVQAPTFVIWALKDPNGANLDRVQVVKIWEQEGQQKEKVFDVAWWGKRKPDPSTGKLPAVANTVDLKTGRYTNAIGASEFKTVWTDPEFHPGRFAAYYLRVLEIPTPRWSTLLAIQHGLPVPKDVPATIQERGWSSPIWFKPVIKNAVGSTATRRDPGGACAVTAIRSARLSDART